MLTTRFSCRSRVSRREWFLQSHHIPTQRFTFCAPSLVTAADVALCKRLIEAYQKATAQGPEQGPEVDGMWSDIIARRYEKAADALAPDRSAGSGAGFGFHVSARVSVGHLRQYAIRRNSHSRRCAYVVSDAAKQRCGIGRIFGSGAGGNPEQGAIGRALQGGLPALVAKIEDALGISLAFPDIGAPVGIKAGRALITPESPEHIYVARRIRQAMERHLSASDDEPCNVVEIGAGFGGTAYWLLQMQPPIRCYTIRDLPLVNVLQGYFLSKTCGPSRVALYGEPTPHEAPAIVVLPTHAVAEISTPVALLINENSMPEMPTETAVEYLHWAKRGVKGIFYSYNQEAYSAAGGRLQVAVPEIVRRVGGLELLSRNASWLRRGYVEEIYRCGEAA